MQSKVDTPNQTSFTATQWDQTQAVCYIWIESMDIKPSRSVYVPNLIPSVQLQFFKYGGVTMLNTFLGTRWQWRHIQRELCGMNFRENIANLRASCYNGNNDQSAQVLFVQHPWEQGKWLCQNPHYTRVLTARTTRTTQWSMWTWPACLNSCSWWHHDMGMHSTLQPLMRG